MLTRFRHIQSDALEVFTYHGRGRNISLERLSQYDIVLTTYETAASDASTSRNLSKISWFRIVLDEGILSLIARPTFFLLSKLNSSFDPKPIDKNLPRDYKTTRRAAMVSNRHTRSK
jgi:hypothetical protein